MTWKLILPAVLIAIGVTVGLGFFWPFSDSRQQLRLPGVVEIQEVRLASKVGGRVKSVEVHEGDVVEPGRVVVRLDIPELEAQRSQVAARVQAAEAELLKAQRGPRPEERAAAKATADAARARMRRLQEGWREQEIQQARSDLDAAEADLKFALKEFDRIDRLHRQSPGAFSRSDWDAAKSVRDRAQGRRDAAKARLDMLQEGTRQADLDEAAAELRRAEANHQLLEKGTREEDLSLAEAHLNELKARLAELDANVREAEVRAPERALVDVLPVRPGDVVAPNQTVARVLRADDLWVKVYVPETQLGKIKVGMPVTITVDSHPGVKFHGQVIHIAAESEFTPRNVQSVDERRHQVFGIKVRVEDPQGIFKAGMAAEVTFDLQYHR